jgi:hypothetical protein
MKLENVLELAEARGSGSFDYKYWFWAKKGSSYGVGYARQPVELDIQRVGAEAQSAFQGIKDVMDSLEKRGEAQKNLEIVEKKIKANTKRIQGIIDLFGSPVVVNWLSGIKPGPTKDELEAPTGERPTVVMVPTSRKGDVTTLSDEDINVIRLFRDAENANLVKQIDWNKVKINDQEGDTQNTIMAKFVSNVFGKSVDKKQLRAVARGSGVEDIMKSLKFKDEKRGIEVVPFAQADYKLFPADMLGSKKMVSYLGDLVKDKFPQVLKRARAAF